MDRFRALKGVVLGLLGLWLLELVVVSMASSAYPSVYAPPKVTEATTEQERASILCESLVSALDQELRSFWGWLPNDLFFVPSIVDNRANFQRGIIYATRPVSDMLAKTAARYGSADTIDQRLADATSRYFTYGESVWGWLVIYDAESKYRNGIENWRNWAKSVNDGSKKAGKYNVKSDDVYAMLKCLDNIMDYGIGILNDQGVGHFRSDDVIYFTKGLCLVAGNVLRALGAVDDTLVTRGGDENLKEALAQFDYIEDFNPIYCFAGGNATGDAMMPNHVAALARHLNIANDRINDMMASMEK
ncbi:MAG: DUF2333 family protein [Succinivibrionaceae bacterium]|nr:DUF2333 family protein [Succinivibrionaceae bacterium]